MDATQSPTNRQGFRDLEDVLVRSMHHDVCSTAVEKIQQVGPGWQARHVHGASATLTDHLAVDGQKRPSLFMCAVHRPNHRLAHCRVGVHPNLLR